MIEELGPDRVGAAVEAFAYSGWFRCPDCRCHGDSAAEATSAVAYVFREKRWAYVDDMDAMGCEGPTIGPIQQWAVLRAHPGCAASEVRDWPMLKRNLLPWREVDPIEGALAPGDEGPAHRTWFPIVSTVDGELPIVLMQPMVAEPVFVSPPDSPDPVGKMSDPYHGTLDHRGARCGVYLGRLLGHGPPEASVARRLAGWSLELPSRTWCMVKAPTSRPGFMEPVEPLPFVGSVGGGPVPIVWHDLAHQAGEVLFIVVPPGTLDVEVADEVVLHESRLAWHSASQGGLHGGLIAVERPNNLA